MGKIYKHFTKNKLLTYTTNLTVFVRQHHYRKKKKESKYVIKIHSKRAIFSIFFKGHTP